MHAHPQRTDFQRIAHHRGDDLHAVVGAQQLAITDPHQPADIAATAHFIAAGQGLIAQRHADISAAVVEQVVEVVQARRRRCCVIHGVGTPWQQHGCSAQPTQREPDHSCCRVPRTECQHGKWEHCEGTFTGVSTYCKLLLQANNRIANTLDNAPGLVSVRRNMSRDASPQFPHNCSTACKYCSRTLRRIPILGNPLFAEL